MLRPDEHLDEGTIHAWLDGALNDVESAEVAAHVESCASCAAAVAEARGLIAAASRILGHLDDVPSEVIPIAPEIPTIPLRKPLPWFRRVPAQAAAVLVLAAFGKWFVMREHQFVRIMPRPQQTQPVAAAAPATPVTTSTDSRTSASGSSSRPTPLALAPAPSTSFTPMMKTTQADQVGNVERAKANITPSTVSPAAGIARESRGAQDAIDYRSPSGVQVDSHTVTSEGTPAAPSAHPMAAMAPSAAKASGASPNRLRNAIRSGFCDKKTIPLRSGVDITLITSDSATITSPTCLSTEPLGMHTLRWTDSVTHHVNILRGPVSRAELDSLKHTLR